MTLGLAMITNDAEATKLIIDKYDQYFDKFFITVGSPTKAVFYDLQKVKNKKLNLTYFKTPKDPNELDFSAIRNANLKTIDTDYWYWIDSDDEIENPERLKELLRYAIDKKTDVIYLKYNYAQNQHGDAISDHWRERLVRTKFRCYWDAPVHETLQSKVPAETERIEWMIVKHDKTPAEVGQSMVRNKMILANHFKKTSDPRDAYYLGMTLLGESNPKGATQWFLQHIKTSGSDEDKYRSWCRIADAEWMQKDYDQSLYATDEAIKLRPNFPDAYFIKVLNYTSIEEYDKGIEWLKVAAAKPIPDTMAMVDPTLYKYRGMSMGAMCYLFSGRVQEAFRLYQAIIAEAPDFYKEMKEIDGVDWPAMYQEAYYDQQAINHVKYLLYYTGANHGKPLKLFEALPPRLLSDVRLNVERAKFLPKINWPEKSIAIYCGPGVESWGPDTMAKGMGGSEEAIVYLSRELAKLGWQVIVYNDREEEYSADGVTYKPWTLLNPFDRFNVFYAWRSPENTRNIRARRIICDLHDTVQADRIYACDDKVKFFVKSQYHRSLYPELPDDRFIVVGNGIDKSHFKPVKTDRTYDIGYFSSCDRGLECLLSLIPKIEEKLGRPVKSCWAYGWDTFDAMHSKNPDMMKWKWSIIRKMNDVGMENKNRLSHQDLAKLMQDTRVWAYPTEFTEIHCITALKAGEAGCIPVTTDCYALEETVADKTYSVQCQDIYTNQVKQKLFVDTVVKALATKDYRPQQVPNAYWSDVAKVWSEELA